MKKLGIENTEEHKNSEVCIAREYDFQKEELNLAVCKISGRYPDTGVCYNTKSTEMIYFIKGSGKIYINSKEYECYEKDAVLINRAKNTTLMQLVKLHSFVIRHGKKKIINT